MMGFARDEVTFICAVDYDETTNLSTCRKMIIKCQDFYGAKRTSEKDSLRFVMSMTNLFQDYIEEHDSETPLKTICIRVSVYDDYFDKTLYRDCFIDIAEMKQVHNKTIYLVSKIVKLYDEFSRKGKFDTVEGPVDYD